MASLCAKQQKAQCSGGRKNCHHQQLLHCGHFAVLSWPSSLSALVVVCSSTASLCLYFLQLSAFVDDFFIIMILLLGSGDTLMKCYEPEVIKNNCHHSLLIMWWAHYKHFIDHSLWPLMLSLTHNYQVFSSQSLTKHWRQSQQHLCCKNDIWHNFSRTLLWL